MLSLKGAFRVELQKFGLIIINPQEKAHINISRLINFKIYQNSNIDIRPLKLLKQSDFYRHFFPIGSNQT